MNEAAFPASKRLVNKLSKALNGELIGESIASLISITLQLIMEGEENDDFENAKAILVAIAKSTTDARNPTN